VPTEIRCFRALKLRLRHLNPTSVLPVTSAGKTYFVAVDMDGTSTRSGIIRCNVDNPLDVVFVDEIGTTTTSSQVRLRQATIPACTSTCGWAHHLAMPIGGESGRRLINP
jgi:hypothetical protein